MSLEKKLRALLDGVNTLAIVCNQWGDTGKGKFVDFFASTWADIIIRGTGGANAGHTICIGGQKYVFHLIPSGILFDADGKINVIGNNVAFDPAAVRQEMDVLDQHKMTYNNLMIAYNAKLVLPQHIVMDRVKEAGRKKNREHIGTTGRGIGYVYSDHVARIGLTVQDMFNEDIFRKKLAKNLEDKIKLLRYEDPEIVKEVFHQDILGNGRFYVSDGFFSNDAIIDSYIEFGRFFRDFVRDTDGFARSIVGKEKVLLEGAQGHLLSVDYGSYPYVTSSDCSVGGLAKGAGLSEKRVDLVLGIVKAFYMTRVGGGPFPTEFGGSESEKWCDNHTEKDELENYPDVSANSSSEFEQGIVIRRVGGEYGATTKRPRRTGWLDLPLLRYAAKTNGRNVILTKLDVMSDCDTIKICEYYKYDGPPYYLGGGIIKPRDKILMLVMDAEVLKNCKPVYREFEGWNSDISGVTNYEDLPKQVKRIIEFVEESAIVNARIISVGPERNQTIIR